MNSRTLVQGIARAYDRLRPPPPGLVVLIYHRVGGGTDSMVDLPTEVFEAQMTQLTAARPVLTLDHAIDELAAGRTPDGVVLTFDDGTSDFHDIAVPILHRLGLPCTLYAATGFIDRGDPMPWGAPSATWNGLRDTLTSGLVTVGSHTRDHPLLDTLSREAVAEQLDASITSITQQLGVAPRHFAYPKAVPGNAVAEIAVRARFASAALAGNRVNIAGGDPHRLWRTPVHRHDSADVFARKLHGGLRVEGAIREQVARWRAWQEHR
ncbi:MAG: polysaccharide deacetylase family protein [Actinomycetota bacterium]|nr:polysaccharide deacetylase family protein [Actinomycetota bacterium]